VEVEKRKRMDEEKRKAGMEIIKRLSSVAKRPKDNKVVKNQAGTLDEYKRVKENLELIERNKKQKRSVYKTIREI
jgi:hypothetical protein